MYIDSTILEIVKLGLLFLIVVTVLGLGIVNFGFDIRAVMGHILNRINLDRYVNKVTGRVIQLPGNSPGITINSTHEELAAVLSHCLGVVLTPGDFSQMTLVSTREGLQLYLRCSFHSRLFYGATTVSIAQNHITLTEAVILNTELSGLELP